MTRRRAFKGEVRVALDLAANVILGAATRATAERAVLGGDDAGAVLLGTGMVVLDLARGLGAVERADYLKAPRSYEQAREARERELTG